MWEVNHLEARDDAEALVGAMLAGAFGLAWALWGAAGVAGSAAVIIRVVGIVIGLLILGCSVWLRRSIRREDRSAEVMGRKGGSGSMFSSAGYRLVVGLEVIGLFGGGALLGATGHSEYTIAWYASVVGIHFLVLGRLYWAGFYLLGAALIAAGFVGAIVGLAGGSSSAVKATSGLVAATSLFTAGSWTVLRAWTHAQT
jgi:hypothetical protein